MAASHTPGPWTFGVQDSDQRHAGLATIHGVPTLPTEDGLGQRYGTISACKPCFEVGEEEQRSNALLMAAAPDLLVQLKGLLGFARFVIKAVDIDTEQTKVVLRNKGEFVAEVPIATLLEHTEAALAKAEGR